MVGNLGRPEAGDVAIVDIALDGLAESRGAAGGIDFPARGEDDGAAHGNMRLGRCAAGSLQGDESSCQRRLRGSRCGGLSG